MFAFSYADRFTELGNLSQARKLDVLQQAHQLVNARRGAVVARLLCSLAAGLLIAAVPLMFLEVPRSLQTALMFAGVFTAIFVLQKSYALALHQQVRCVLAEQASVGGGDAR